jgi:hypothetical protein
MPKLSQIASGGSFNPATDQIIVVRNGTTDVLTSLPGLRVITAAGAVTMTGADVIVEIAQTVPAACTVNLPSSPVTGQVQTVIDGAQNASTYPITLVPASGLINGQATAVIGLNGDSRDIYWNGTAWRIK